ncbi:conserved protein of unknown function [Tenacibaculum sp. 190130A14a]|uniref:Plasmid pRiA4b Orf3-like domain-containing protein n=1 Tax=Tenacibaculum polynesiense TaxID=3137857 RepID=A0ABP1ETH9_9FLAO
MYKVRVILDTQEDVIRTLMVNEKETLESLHFTIAKAFGFDGQEMASFYRTDEEWNQGEEIPLFNMAEAGEGISMATCVLNETLPKVHDKLIYVYDFLHMWAFYVEVIEVSSQEIDEAKLLLSVGEVPAEAQEKEFKSEDIMKGFDDEFKDEFDDLDRIDDFDFNNF